MLDLTINEVIHDTLGDVIMNHCTVKGFIFVVEVNDPAWATQLKFLEKQICKTLSQTLDVEIKGLEIRVRRLRPDA
jgi:hypothetical protein